MRVLDAVPHGILNANAGMTARIPQPWLKPGTAMRCL
jgi:hypothetical protein